MQLSLILHKLDKPSLNNPLFYCAMDLSRFNS
jgi:hypothetical protein